MFDKTTKKFENFDEKSENSKIFIRNQKIWKKFMKNHKIHQNTVGLLEFSIFNPLFLKLLKFPKNLSEKESTNREKFMNLQSDSSRMQNPMSFPYL